MKAAVLRGIEDIRIEDIPEPQLPEDGTIIKVEACGICGSDVRTYYSGTTYVKPPAVLGHEIAGTVVELGPKCKSSLKIGDQVAVATGIPCGECFFCTRGRFNLCVNSKSLLDGMSGGFAEFMPLPGDSLARGCVTPIPEGLDLHSAAISECACSVTKCWEELEVKPIDAVVVIGAGPVGSMHCQMAKLRGASLVIQADLVDKRLEMAEKFGADHLINNSKVDIEEFVLDKTGGLGAAIVIVAAPSTEACASSLKLVRQGGIVVAFGGFPSKASTVPFDGNLIHYRDLVIRGTIGFSRRHQEMVLQLASRRRLSLSSLITRTVPLSGVVDGIQTMKEGKDMKVVAEPWRL